jgi:hypothetical protein
MTVTIHQFLGKDVTVPADRSYHAEEGLWLREESDGRFAVGLTEPSVVLAGTIRDFSTLVNDGEEVEAGQAVLLALTGRLKFLGAPMAGTVSFQPNVSTLAAEAVAGPYDTPLFFIVPAVRPAGELLSASEYAEWLKQSEGTRNPGGATGGVSPTCKAVYMGLAAQKLSDTHSPSDK